MALDREDLPTPVLLIRLDRVRANLQRMLQHVGGDLARWRPHVKTSKIPEVFDLLLGAGVRQFKCATTREARVLLARGDDPLDLLIAFPHHGTNLHRVAGLVEEFPGHRVSILTEHADHAAEARRLSPGLGIFLDLDPGYHRTGMPLADRARIRAAFDAAGPALRGLHYYDGHLHSGSPEDRRAQCDGLYGELLELVSDLGLAERCQTGADPADALELITSGTPTFEQALAYDGFAGSNHRVSPGTVVYSDLRTEELGVDGFARAAHVLTRVVSVPGPTHITCDAGSKAVDAAAGDPCAAAEGWPGLVAQTPSEEHLPFLVDSGEAPHPGTLLELVPRHVCPTVNLADDAVLIDGADIVGIVPVAARGHETR